jgi:hypothetical protein
MAFRVQIYCESDGIPSPLDPETITAATAKAAAERLTGGTLLEAGHHGKLAAMVWREGEPHPKKVPFYRP